MAKQTRIQKQTHLQNSQGKGFQQEQLESFDDNLLPDANEIKELFVLDSEILTWLKNRAEKEQDFRHNLIHKRTTILEKELKSESRNTFIGIIFAFLIIIAGMALSAFLIQQKYIITGTIFSGITIISSATLFLRGSINSTGNKSTNQKK